MKNHWKRSAAVAAGVVAACVLWSGTQAQASTITFGTNAGTQDFYPIGPTYTEQGYTFTAAPGKQLAMSGNGTSPDPDPTNSVSLINYSTVEAVTLTRSDHGTFDLASMDFQGYHSPTAIGNGNIILYWVDGNGIGGLDTFSVKNNAWSTDVLSLKNLRSFSWIPGGDINHPSLEQTYFVWVDNVVVSSTAVATTPLPAALPLFAAGLGALGVAKRRQRKKASAA